MQVQLQTTIVIGPQQFDPFDNFKKTLFCMKSVLIFQYRSVSSKFCFKLTSVRSKFKPALKLIQTLESVAQLSKSIELYRIDTKIKSIIFMFINELCLTSIWQ